MLGAVVGALVCGRIAERFGRRPLLACLCVLFFVVIAAAAIANGYWVLMLGRFIMGIAVGGVSAMVPTYLGEMASAQIRDASSPSTSFSSPSVCSPRIS